MDAVEILPAEPASLLLSVYRSHADKGFKELCTVPGAVERLVLSRKTKMAVVNSRPWSDDLFDKQRMALTLCVRHDDKHNSGGG